MTATVAGVRIAASTSAGRYDVKYGRNPSRPRITTAAASSRRCRPARRAVGGGHASAAPAPPRSAITARAPRWPSRACSQVTAARTVHSANRIRERTRPVAQRPGRRIGDHAGDDVRQQIADAMAHAGSPHRSHRGDQDGGAAAADARHSRGRAVRAECRSGRAPRQADRCRYAVGRDALAGTPNTSSAW